MLHNATAVARAAATKDAAAHSFEVVPQRGRGRGVADGESSDSDDSSSDEEGRVANKGRPPAEDESSDEEDQDYMDSLDAQGKVR